MNPPVAVAAICLALVVGVTGIGRAAQHAPVARVSCKTVNAKYPHGVGRPGARDKTSRGAGVTNFTRNKKLYERYRGLDRDHDGIACEKK